MAMFVGAIVKQNMTDLACVAVCLLDHVCDVGDGGYVGTGHNEHRQDTTVNSNNNAIPT